MLIPTMSRLVQPGWESQPRTTSLLESDSFCCLDGSMPNSNTLKSMLNTTAPTDTPPSSNSQPQKTGTTSGTAEKSLPNSTPDCLPGRTQTGRTNKLQDPSTHPKSLSKRSQTEVSVE
ncbi:hypothetical protein BCR33DRAFT_850852 [Rhizoclosmatium globosum]|uniref:Uncharacterized protein n=1 Tax=Rhizoclosmatium globosum TaxID=329046 RepID=A0A1Y2C9C2_9FUNG|nr:hypothetical protein BCR33DRAFT_850852 [Rhizoclosmatium globosum]|eukprot:ORY43619.1 hypothetical protein BCR33DRAFT_850852 [Rhizoclosmatium globosum]